MVAFFCLISSFFNYWGLFLLGCSLLFMNWSNLDMMSEGFIFMTFIVMIALSYFSTKGVEKFLFFGICLCFVVKSYLWFLVSFEFILIPISLFIFMGKTGERFSALLYLLAWTLIFSSPVFIWFLLEEMSGEIGMMNNWSSLDGFSFLTLLLVGMFFVKFPVFMFHIWLPRAHVEAPTFGSVILAACLLKLGTYGFFRFISLMEIYDLFWVSFWGVILSCLICMSQSDLKSFIAYSSVVHMSVLMCVYFSSNVLMLSTVIVASVSHGFISALLFLFVGGNYDDVSSRSILVVRGISFSSTLISILWFIVCVMNCGLPPFLSFFSEVFIIFPIFSYLSFSSIIFPLYIVLNGLFCYLLFVSQTQEKEFLTQKLTSFLLSEVSVVFLSWGLFFLI